MVCHLPTDSEERLRRHIQVLYTYLLQLLLFIPEQASGAMLGTRQSFATLRQRDVTTQQHNVQINQVFPFYDNLLLSQSFLLAPALKNLELAVMCELVTTRFCGDSHKNVGPNWFFQSTVSTFLKRTFFLLFHWIRSMKVWICNSVYCLILRRTSIQHSANY